MDLIRCLILTEVGNWIVGNVLHSFSSWTKYEQERNSSFDDDDGLDTFADVGLDYDELEFMDPDERREVLEDAGLDPDEFDF